MIYQTQALIQTRFLTAIMTVIPKNDIRYYLNGLHLYALDGQLTLEATDGHRALRITCPADGELDKRIIPRDIVETALKIAKAQKSENVILTVSDEHSTLNGIGFQAINGKFPDLNRVIPSKSDETCDPTPAAFNIAYITDWGKIQAALLGKAKTAFKPTFCPDFHTPSDRAARFTFHYKETRAVYVLMGVPFQAYNQYLGEQA